MVALVVLAALGSIVAVVTGGTSAEAAVINSVNSTMADQTAHITMSLSAHTPTATVTATGTGGIDFGHNAMQLQVSTGVGGQQINIQAVYVDGSVYENIPGLDQMIPGKSWVSVDLSSLGDSTSQSPSSLGTGDNPTAMLRLLTQQGNTVVPLGSSTVDGTSVQGYSVTLDSSAIKAELAQAKLPSWMTSALREVDIQNTTFKVYVDGAGLLRRMSVGLTESVGSAGTLRVDETLDLSDYGSAVTVGAPPPDQVASLQQVLEAAQAALGSSST
jgi:hypothetical protein